MLLTRRIAADVHLTYRRAKHLLLIIAAQHAPTVFSMAGRFPSLKILPANHAVLLRIAQL